MKPIPLVLVLAITLAGFGAPQVHADREAAAAIGGFVIGMITGSIISDSSDDVIIHETRSYHHDAGYRGDRRDQRDYRGNSNWRGDHRNHGDYRSSSHRKDGYWEVRTVRVWQPGRWVIKVERCGTKVRVWQKGFHRIEKQRVWVSTQRHRGNAYCG